MIGEAVMSLDPQPPPTVHRPLIIAALEPTRAQRIEAHRQIAQEPA